MNTKSGTLPPATTPAPKPPPPPPEPPTQMHEQQKVWLVGGSPSEATADVYASHKSAMNAVMDYLFGDDRHWLNKLSEVDRRIVVNLKRQPELALAAYNRFCKPEDQWSVCEATVQY